MLFVMSQADTLERLDAFNSFEIKADAEGAVGIVEGYASYFGERDGGNDIVVRGAFKKSLAERRKDNKWHIPMFLGHVHNGAPVGVWTDLAEDARGLKVKGQLILESGDAKQLYAVMKAGGAMGLSIGYRTIKREMETVKDGENGFDTTIRKLLEVDLREISLVGMPMLDSARVTKVKSEGEAATPDPVAAAVIRELKSMTDTLSASAAISRGIQNLKF